MPQIQQCIGCKTAEMVNVNQQSEGTVTDSPYYSQNPNDDSAAIEARGKCLKTNRGIHLESRFQLDHKKLEPLEVDGSRQQQKRSLAYL